MTARERWDEMRSLIEAGWHSGWGDPCNCGTRCQTITGPRLSPGVYCAAIYGHCIDTKQAQHDGSRQIYGGLGTPQRED